VDPDRKSDLDTTVAKPKPEEGGEKSNVETGKAVSDSQRKTEIEAPSAPPSSQKRQPIKPAAEPIKPIAADASGRGRVGEPSQPAALKNGAASSKFVLQAAAFRNERAAQNLSERLRQAGFQPFIERVDTREGARFRVRVGPYASRIGAQQAQAKLQGLGVMATIVPFKST
jgi:DedD protein